MTQHSFGLVQWMTPEEASALYPDPFLIVDDGQPQPLFFSDGKWWQRVNTFDDEATRALK